MDGIQHTPQSANPLEQRRYLIEQFMEAERSLAAIRSRENTQTQCAQPVTSEQDARARLYELDRIMSIRHELSALNGEG